MSGDLILNAALGQEVALSPLHRMREIHPLFRAAPLIG
jgi:hypothetical protein